MVCEVKVNSIKYLQKEKATDDVRRIIDTAKFDELNQSLTKLAVDKYGLETNGENLFENREIKIKDERTSTYRRDTIVTLNRAEPNEPLFEKLQELKIRYDERKAIADNAILPKSINLTVNQEILDLFKLNPELANIGTPEQYAQYLNTIFPNSLSKDILFHGSDKVFDVFDKSKRGSATGAYNFEDPEQTPVDSLNAFFFSTDIAVSQQYSILRRIEQIENITAALSNTLFDWSKGKEIRKYSPELSDHLKEKQKELSTEQLKEYIRELYSKYNKVNKDLGTGFLNLYNNYTRLGKQLKDLKSKKKDILSGKYEHNSFTSTHPNLGISLYNGVNNPGEMGIYIYDDGKISSSEYNGRNISSLSSEEFDNLISIGEESYQRGIENINSILKKAKITPVLYRVLLNIQKPFVKDFEKQTFVNQVDKAGAQYEASKLTNQAAKSNGEYDSVVYKNILDPYLSDNYGVFEPEQIHILGSKKDIENFKQFVKTGDTQSMFIRTDNNIPVIPIDLKTINRQQSKAVAETLASKLSAKMGVNYHNVTPEQATEMLKNSPVPYRGEPAFFYNGAVFIVGDNVHPGITLHEFAHPLLQAIRKTNPALFNKLYDDLLKTQEGLGIAEHVINSYPELIPDSDLFKEEILTFALQLKSLNKLEQQIETEGFKSFINKLLASLKQLLRDIFGNVVNVKNLNESTSLDELAEMLLDDTMFDFGEVNLTEDDLVMYVRDIFNEADKLATSVKAEGIQEMINEVYISNLAIVNQIKDFKADKVTREMLEKALKKQNTTNLLTGVKEILAGYQNINNISSLVEEDAENLEKDKQMAAALVNSIDRINTSSQNVIKELNNIIKQPSLINNRNTIALLGLYKNTSQSWLNVIGQINEIIDSTEVDKNSEFYSLITSIVNNATIINSKIANIYKKGNVQFFVEITGYMNDFVNKELKSNLGIALKNVFSESELEKAVDDLYSKVVDQTFTPEDAQALYDKGVPANVLEEFIKKYNNYVVNEDKIKEALTGHAKDVSWFNRWLESYSSSNDIIVGPLAMYIQNQKTEVETKVWRMSQDFRAQLEVLLPQVNFSKMNPTQIRDMVAEKDQIFYFDKKTGKYEAREVFTFLNEFGNGWRFELDKLEYEYEEAKKTGDKDKIAKALGELREFSKDYMWQEFTLDFYEKDDVFKDSSIGTLAYAARRSALENYVNLQNSLQKEYERFERHSELQEAFKTYQRLYSLQNEDGTQKVDDPAKGIYDKSIAELLIKHRQETNKFYEWVPITNSLDTAYNEFVSELLTKDIKKDSKEYEKLLREWQKQNVRVVYSQEYYDERTRLFERLNSIQSQINEQLKTDYNVSDEYKKILDLLYTFKDDFGQPDATQLGEERLRKIKDIQQNIIDVRQKLDKYTGLSREDSAMLTELITKSRDEELTNEEAEELDRLITAKKDIDINLVEALSEVIGELSDISSKYPTDYYMDALETHMSQYENIPAFTDVTVDQFINGDLFKQMIDSENELFDEDLYKWFELNHVELQVYEDGKLVTKYQRTAANSYSKPTNPKHFINTKIKDNQTGEIISIIGVPNIRHSRREVKNEYRTIPRGASRKDYVGKVIDNKGNFLPRSFEPGNKNSAKDARFISDRYQKIKANPNSPEYKLLEVIKAYHLQLQEGASSYGKLYLDVPRYGIERGDFYQVLQKGEYGERFKEIRSNVKEWTKQLFGKSVQDNLEQFNYNAENNLVNTDLQGNEISYIPVTGIYNLDTDKVDADIFNSLFKYGLSVQTQSSLIKSLPLVNSIMETLEDPTNQPKNLDAFSKGIYTLRKKQQHPTRANATNNRSGQVRSLVEREYYGRQVVGIEENHPVLSKWLNTLTSRSSRAALALNIPSDLKNQVSGYIQTIIEASGNRFISGRDLALSASWTTKAMLEWTTKGIYEVGPGAISTQLVQVFDPNFKATDENGKPVYRSLYKDLVNGDWMYMHRKFGEMEVAMRLFGAFLHAEKIEQNYSDGSKSLINYTDAWEKDENGILKLKEGIHPGWNYESVYHTYTKGEKLEDIAKKYNISLEELKAKNQIKSEIQLEDGQEIVIAKSEYFKQFKNKLQGTSRALFGVYDKFGQPEGNKYIMYRMFFFMRKWFTPMFVNRFGMDTSKDNFGGSRYDWAMGRTTKGYYVEAFQALYKILKSKGADYQYLTDDQKGAIKRSASEGLVMITTALLASMLFGFDDDDPDKWKKIKAKSGALFTDEFNTYGYISNHALLLLLGVQAETGAFIPLPSIGGMNFGADDYAKLMTSTTTAFGNTLLTYIEIFGDILNLITFNDEAVRYKKDVGPYWWQKKGELKTYKRIFNMLGLTGGIGDPETSLKNLSKGSTRIR